MSLNDGGGRRLPGGYKKMPITSSNQSRREDLSSSFSKSWLVFTAFHAVCFQGLSLVVLSAELWSEIFGGNIFALVRPAAFQPVCLIALSVFLPLVFVAFRTSLEVKKHNPSLRWAVYAFAVVQALSHAALGNFFGAQLIASIVLSTFAGAALLLLTTSCCAGNEGILYFFQSATWNTVHYTVYILLSIASIVLCGVKQPKMGAVAFLAALWWFSRFLSTLAAVYEVEISHEEFEADFSEDTVGWHQVALGTFYLDVYFILPAEYAVYMTLSCCCSRKCMNRVGRGKNYYPYAEEDEGESTHGEEEGTLHNRDLEAGHYIGSKTEEGPNSFASGNRKEEESESSSSSSGEDDAEESRSEAQEDESDSHTAEETQKVSDEKEVGKEPETEDSIDIAAEDLFEGERAEEGEAEVLSVQVDEQVDVTVSGVLKELRETERSFEAYMSQYDRIETTDYLRLLRGLYKQCLCFGVAKEEFSSLTWRSFTADLKKYENPTKSQKKSKSSKKTEKRIKSQYPGIQDLDLIFHEVEAKIPHHNKRFNAFVMAWQELASKTLFNEKVTVSEITFTKEFGIPMGMKLSEEFEKMNERERSIQRIMTSNALGTLLQRNRSLLKSLFVYYSKTDKRHASARPVRMSLLSFLAFCEDMSISPNKISILKLRKIFEHLGQAADGEDQPTLDLSGRVFEFGQFKFCLFRMALEMDRNLKSKKRGTVKAGESARALKVLFHKIERDGGLGVAARKGANIRHGFNL
jgi:hypothetical protein|eukprot:g5056.t1